MKLEEITCQISSSVDLESCDVNLAGDRPDLPLELSHVISESVANTLIEIGANVSDIFPPSCDNDIKLSGNSGDSVSSTYTNSKLFTCSICDKTFKSKIGLS